MADELDLFIPPEARPGLDESIMSHCWRVMAVLEDLAVDRQRSAVTVRESHREVRTMQDRGGAGLVHGDVADPQSAG